MARPLIGTYCRAFLFRKNTALSEIRYPCFLKRWYVKGLKSDLTEEDIELARKWLAGFNPDTLPHDIGDVSFSRSSGPGGQNVNKWASWPSDAVY